MNKTAMEAAVANPVRIGSVQITLSGMINGSLVAAWLFLASVTGAAVTKASPATRALSLTCQTAKNTSLTPTKVARKVHAITKMLLWVLVKIGSSLGLA